MSEKTSYVYEVDIKDATKGVTIDKKYFSSRRRSIDYIVSYADEKIMDVPFEIKIYDNTHDNESLTINELLNYVSLYNVDIKKIKIN